MINLSSSNNHKTLAENSFVVKIVRFFEKHELLISAIFLLSILINALKISGWEHVITSIASAIACIYFFSAYQPISKEGSNAKILFLTKLSSIGAAVATIGIMFSVLNWQGSRAMLLGGLLTSIVYVLASLYWKNTSEPITKLKLRRFIFRGSFLLILCSVYYFTPKEKLIDLGLTKERPIMNQTEQPEVER